MSDDTKLHYRNSWDIDQLIDTVDVSVSSGATTIYTIPSSLNNPTFDVHFMPAGVSSWYRPGANSSNATISGLFTFYAYQLGSSIVFSTDWPGGGVARVILWGDKIDY